MSISTILKPTKIILFMLVIIAALSSCNRLDHKQGELVEDPSSSQELSENPSPSPTDVLQVNDEAEPVSNDIYTIITTNGTTLESRINPPKNYTRIASNSDEITSFMRGLKLKEDGSSVLLYDGSAKGYQDGHIAVFDIDVGERDLQQCADSIIRIYAEYYWSIGSYNKIAFHLTNGFLMEYTKWREGNRLVVEGNDVRWNKTREYDDSYDSFRKYLDMVYVYAGTLSLSQEVEAITLEDLRPGDMFLQGGSPGHCVLVVDIAEEETGNRSYLLAQGYMPAQDFHVLKNPLHPEDPWYYASELSFPLKTPSWTFEEDSLVRWSNFSLSGANTSAMSDGTSTTVSSGNTDSLPAMSDEVQTITDTDNSQVTLLAVGDNLIHIEVVKSGKQQDGTYNYDHLYANLKDDITAADIAIINQETILGGDEFAYSGYPNFNSPTEIGDAVIEAGFDVILQATNHTMDKGFPGVENTFDYWKLHPEITVLGINESKALSNEIPIVEKNGIKIAMLNYTYGLNGKQMPKDKTYLVNLLDKRRMKEDIKNAKELADFVIVFPHWGTEYVYEATKTQKDLTNFYYDQGVDLIIGTHPHVLEPVEWVGTSEGDHRMLVYYSLGNFVSYQREAPRMLGGMASITITKDDSHTYISNAGITPIVTHYENGPADYNYGIYKLTEYTEKLALKHGVLKLEKQGQFTYQGTVDLAKQILGSWLEYK